MAQPTAPYPDQYVREVPGPQVHSYQHTQHVQGTVQQPYYPPQQSHGYPQQQPYYPAQQQQHAYYPNQGVPVIQQPTGWYAQQGVPPQRVVYVQEQPRSRRGANTEDCCLIAMWAMCCACWLDMCCF